MPNGRAVGRSGGGAAGRADSYVRDVDLPGLSATGLRARGQRASESLPRLGAPVQHRYLWEDLERWFDEAGLVVDAHREETGWFILAQRA